MKVKEQINILKLVDSINANFFIIELIDSDSRDGYMFRFVGTPMGYNTYLAINYSSVVSSMTPGLVRCHDEAEALMFLNLIAERLESEEPFDYQKVLEAAQAIEWNAIASAASSHSDEHDPESLPFEGDAPYWVLDERIPSNAHIVYTANWAAECCSSDIPIPQDSEEGNESKSILLYTVGDVGGEKEVQLCDDDGNCFGLEEGSLEWFLWCQLFCHNKNLAVEKPRYGYFLYDIIGGVWLLPEPRNLKFLPKILTCHDWLREKEEDFVILQWLDAAQKNLEKDEDMDEEEYQECKKMIQQYKERYCTEDA